MRTVLITGANRGIGMLSALVFARRGFRVAAGSRSIARARELRALAVAENLAITVIQLDVCDPTSVRTAVAEVEHTMGPIDVLVNNAGAITGGPIETTDIERARDLVDTNFFGPLRVIQAVVPLMRERRSGSIILLGSLHGHVPAPGSGVYAASKQATAAMHDALAFEVEPFGITVSSTEPGPYRTAIADEAGQGAAYSGPYAPMLTALAARQRTRLAESDDPIEVAEAVVELATMPRPPLRRAVGQHARASLGDNHYGDEFLRHLRTELAHYAPGRNQREEASR